MQTVREIIVRRAMRAAALCLVTLVVTAMPAHAQVQTKDQQKCTNAMNKDFANVAKTLGKDIGSCVKDNAKGKLIGMTAEQCFTADRKGKVGKATTKTTTDFAKSCTGGNFPPFGVVDAATTNQAAIDKENEFPTVLFGADPDTALITESTSVFQSKCQQAVFKALQGCQDAQLKEFLSCKKTVIGTGGDAASDLVPCVLADPKLKIAKKCNLVDGSRIDKVRKELGKKCEPTGADPAVLFPGCNESDYEALHACLTTSVACLACEAITAADGLVNVGCDLKDNGAFDGSCGPAPICGNSIAEGGEECDDGDTDPGDGCSATCQLESVNPALCAGIPSTSGTALDTVLVASGYSAPVHVTSPRLDPSRLFVVEQEGRIMVIKNGVQLGTPFLDIDDVVQGGSGSEEGLLSMAFHPDYETNGHFFVYYTNNDGDLEIERYTVSGNPDVADESSATPVLTVPHPDAGNHNGGNLNFGPDGFLYAATGDGGGGGDPDENAQDDGSQLGKLLRINPTDFTTTNWAKGLRNPFRFSFDRLNGDVYIGDVGQGRWEEVSYAAANPSGVNYGWDDREGRHCFEPGSGCLTAGRTDPVLEYCNESFSDAACDDFQDEKGQAVTGGFVYRGCAMPDVQGRYFYSDFYTAFIRSFEGVSGGDAQDLQNHTADVNPPGSLTIDNVSSFGEDARGELYIVDYDGEIYRIVPGT